MKKAVQLDVRLWIEADDEPAHDFAAAMTDVVRQVLADGAKAHPELIIKIRAITERHA